MKSVAFIVALFVANAHAAGTWSAWGTAGDICTNCPGATFRGNTRVCIPGADGSPCVGSRITNEVCNCPTTGEWDDWAEWTVCDQECGFCGTQSRTRTCKALPECPGLVCVGDTSESKSCSLTNKVCMAPSTSCCTPYKKKIDLVAKKFYCGLP